MVSPIILSPHDIASKPPESFSSSTPRGDVTWKTLLSAPSTPTSTFTTGIATCPPKTGHLKLHRHKQAEIYHVTQGNGSVSIEGKEYAVQKGSIVFIPGDAEHGIKNHGEEDLIWLYVFAADRFEEVVYRFTEEEGLKA